jgi:arginyl-tRNA synthetase
MAENTNQKVAFYKDKTINLVAESSWDESKLISPILKKDLARILEVELDVVEIEKPKDTSYGDYSSNVALRIAKDLGKTPRDYASEAITKLNTDSELLQYVEKIEMAGPGFINFSLKKDFVLKAFVDLFSAGDLKATNSILKGKRIMFEYAHPNPFKAFHIGHLRNIILGESLIRILESCGAEIIRTNYQGDVGMHIAKCLWAFRQVAESDYPSGTTERVALIAKCYTDGAKAFEDEKLKEDIKAINKSIYTKEDQQINKLWELGKQWSLDKFHELYKRVDSTFVREYMESETLENSKTYVAEAKAKGILEESQGALIFSGVKYGLEPHVFLNSQGLPTYEGKELGLAYMEFHDYGNIDLCIHNVAVEQISFFKATFKVEALLNPDVYQGKQYHNAYEFVGLKSGKMSSRTGNVVLGEDIINEAVSKIRTIVDTREGLAEEQKAKIAEIVGVGAIKYSFLNINPGSYLAFDLEKSLAFDGNSGPYLQYTYARANKIVKDSKVDVGSLALADFENLNDVELKLIKKILEFKDIVIEAGKNLAPNLIATYLFELAQMFNGYYKGTPILGNNGRIGITAKTSEVISQGLKLMGIKVNETM